MLRSALSLSLIAAVLAQGGDPFAGLGCNCSEFCAGACSATTSGRPDKTQNMTLYRMTPLDVDTATDKNTGDGQGDTSYVISRRTAAYDCKVDPTGWHCSTLVVKGDDPDSTDLVISFEMEVDGDWGPYLYCNPTDAKHPDAPWNCTTTLSHGGGGGGGPPPDYPKQCAAMNYTGYDKFCFSARDTRHPPKTLTGVSLGDCCSETLKADGWDYTYFAANQTCVIFEGYSNHASPCEEGVSGHWEQPHDDKTCECPRVHRTAGRRNLTASGTSSMHPAGGEWYSHPHQGECAPGHSVGDGSGCSWRVVGVNKAVNASCVYDRLDKNIEKRNSTCFAGCPTVPSGDYNRTSDCYSECYSHTSSHMQGAELAAPWEAAFTSDVAASGGCPAVQIPDNFRFW